MEKDNRILISAIFVFLILFFVLAKFSGVTGRVILDKPSSSIIISPEVVSIDELIHVTIIPGNKGVNEKVSFYQAEDDLRKTSKELCNSYKCVNEKSFSFLIPNNWEEGVYFIKVYDYGTKTFVIEDFTIRN